MTDPKPEPAFMVLPRLLSMKFADDSPALWNLLYHHTGPTPALAAALQEVAEKMQRDALACFKSGATCDMIRASVAALPARVEVGE